MKAIFKAILPHAIAVIIFLVVAAVYCRPAWQGKVLNQLDVMYWKAMAQQSFKYKEAHGNFPLWTNSLYCGMPAYFIAMDSYNPISPVYLHSAYTWLLPKPVCFFFLMCAGFYFLSQVLNIKPWLGILGGIAYAYCSYSFIIVAVGHDTKALAMGYAPALLASILLVYKKHYWAGAACMVLFTSILFAINHLQVNYYYFLAGITLTTAYTVQWIKRKEYSYMVKSIAICAAAVIIGICTNMVTFATSYDYSNATRKGSLNMADTAQQAKQSAGYDVSYAFRWSYGVQETYTFLIPGIFGGARPASIAKDAGVIKALLAYKIIQPNEVPDIIKEWPVYWGPQPSTSGPVYFGAVMFTLFILSVFSTSGKDKWWMLAACILGILLALGSNAAWLNNLLFKYLPFYNKFRAPSMALVLPQLFIPMLGIIGLQKTLFKERSATAKQLFFGGSLVMAVILLFAAYLYNSFDYKTPRDKDEVLAFFTQSTTDQKAVTAIYNAFLQDRKNLFAHDLLRSTCLVTVCLLVLFFTVQFNMKPAYAVTALLLLAAGDLLFVGARYLNENNYIQAKNYDSTNYAPLQANLNIMRDTGFYRVLDNATYIDARTYYYHNSMTGYSPVTLSVMDDLLKYQQGNNRLKDMLNVKYVLKLDSTNQTVVENNPGALGNCWLVKSIAFTHGDVNTMKTISNINPGDTAVIDTALTTAFTSNYNRDGAAIQLLKNYNDSAVYHFNSPAQQFAVFSEVYYDRGWKAYVNNKETPIIRTNYALRGLQLPAGNYNIRFVFRPASYYTSVAVAIVASVMAWVIVIAAAWQYGKTLAAKKQSHRILQEV